MARLRIRTNIKMRGPKFSCSLSELTFDYSKGIRKKRKHPIFMVISPIKSPQENLIFSLFGLLIEYEEANMRKMEQAMKIIKAFTVPNTLRVSGVL